MTTQRETDSNTTKQRPRLLMLSYCFDPNGTMEERNGWQRAISAAKTFDVTVLYSPSISLADLESSVPIQVLGSIHFEPVHDDRWSRSLRSFNLLFYASYRHWHRLAFRKAWTLHRANAFHISHLVTLCGFREPGYVWQLDVPHVWGPVGGTHNFPLRYLKSLDRWNQLRESLRAAMNYYQLHWCPRVRRAVRKSATIIAATTGAQVDLKRGLGITTERELETGIDHPIAEARGPRQAIGPLKILWTGRLRAWKGLPILLHAVALLPKAIDVHLRVVGDGKSRASWETLALKLGIEACIEWIPWPAYRESLQYYKWADLFAFTSLRDTSGTGLLEALAAGCPILGVNHQGAADIMTDQCALRVSVKDWSTSVSSFRDGIVRMATEPEEWLRLSQGATLRARDFEWNGRSDSVQSIYLKLVSGASVADQGKVEEKLQGVSLTPSNDLALEQK